MATTVTHTIKASGGDYTSLSAWEAAQQRDLVTLDEAEVVEFYKGDYSSSGGGLNYIVDDCTIDGWTTDSTHTITVQPAAGEEHKGIPGAGLQLRITATNWTIGFNLVNQYVTLRYLDILGSNTGHVCIITTDNTVVRECLVKSAAYDGIKSKGADKIINTIAYECGRYGIYEGLGQWDDHYFYNVTVADCSTAGFYIRSDFGSGEHVFLKNCLGANNGTDFSYYNVTSQDRAAAINCASSDATADDATGPSTTGNRISQTFTFVDAANDDYHLASGDAGAKDFGVDLSSDSAYAFNWDIDGDTRTAPWDIGADEVAGGADIRGDAAAQASPSVASSTAKAIVTAAGSPAAGPATVSATVSVIVAATASPAASDSAVSSTVKAIVRANASALAQDAAVAATGGGAKTRGDVDAQADPSTVSSSGAVTIAADGSPAASLALVAATGSVKVVGSASPAAAPSTVAASGGEPSAPSLGGPARFGRPQRRR